MSKNDYTGHPDARKPKGNPLAWLNLLLLAVIVLACNYIGCHEYARKDLTGEEQRFSISERTRNVLQSERIQQRETPVRIIFAFKRSTPNYARMRYLLEEYERYGNGKVEVEYFDPMRQPNRAREISQIYGIDFNQNLCVVDARKDCTVPIKTFEEQQGDRQHVRIRPGTSFVKYETLPDETRRAVALVMDEVVCGALTEAVEGQMRHMYAVEGKGGVSRDDQTMLELIGDITNSLNIQLSWVDVANVDKLPDDAEGLLIVSPNTDFTEKEMDVVREFWEREGATLCSWRSTRPTRRSCRTCTASCASRACAPMQTACCCATAAARTSTSPPCSPAASTAPNPSGTAPPTWRASACRSPWSTLTRARRTCAS